MPQEPPVPDARSDRANMIKPDFPADESSRLAALRGLGVLDTDPEERFDRLTRVARRLFNVPIALVSLVDEDRQWFKSCFGLDARETPREISFCGHAILSGDVFVIPDALADERFHDNPLVTGPPHVRFYAGCPLQLGDGLRVGTLCLIDVKPRSFDEDDLCLLRDLAGMAEQELKALNMATTDELTGLSNRRGIGLLARQVLAACVRESWPVSVLFFDLDGLKLMNDGFGHAAGDRILRDFARLLRAAFRESDLVGRLGGDEFVVLLSNAGSEECESALSRFQRALDQHNSGSLPDSIISCSVGHAGFARANDVNFDALLAIADQRMYATKQARKAARRGGDLPELSVVDLSG